MPDGAASDRASPGLLGMRERAGLPGGRILFIRGGTGGTQVIDEAGWDLALIDIDMPGRGWLELLRELKRLAPALPVLVVSARTEEDFAVRALKLGAAGYVSKQSASEVRVGAVRKVLSGGRYVSPAVAEKPARAAAEGWSGNPHENLSHRELQVLQMISAGKPPVGACQRSGRRAT